MAPTFVLDIFGHPTLLPILSTTVPILQSIRAIHRRRRKLFLGDDLTEEDDAILESCLQYWIPFAMYHTTANILTLLLPRFLVSTCTPSTFTANLALLWVHVPLTHGATFLYSAVVSWMHPYADLLPQPPAEEESTNILLRAATALGVIKTHHANILRDLRAQGPALCGLVFLVTPSFLTLRGCDLVSLAFPAYVAMGTVAAKHRRTHEWWVLYFVVVAILDYMMVALDAILGWVPLLYHLKLLGIMWLQFPYWRGAQVIFDAVFNSVFTFNANDKVVTATASKYDNNQ